MKIIKSVGAGNKWHRTGENLDFSVVKQTNSLSCVAAVGEMLLRSRGFDISQTEIARFIGIPSNSEKLAAYFNSLEIEVGNFLI